MNQCNRCKLKYIGETKRKLKERFNDHRRTIDYEGKNQNPTSVTEQLRLLLYNPEQHQFAQKKTRHKN